MKKIVASVGLVALGASGFNAVHAQDVSAPPSKSWNLTASLRGFYDDNLNTVETTSSADRVFGWEIEPGASLNWGNDQTTVKVGYTYGFKYYDKRPLSSADKFDQNHNFDGSIHHAFNERYQVTVSDAFALGQEPDLLRGTGFTTVAQRVSGNNYHNYGTIVFNAQVTPLLGVEVGYANELAGYADSGAIVSNSVPAQVGEFVGGVFYPGASRAGLMNRIGQTAHLEGQWQMTPQTVGVVGYEFGADNYTGDEPIAILGTNTVVLSKDRNNFHNKVYAGLNHVFLPDLSGTLQGGASVYDYYNNVGTSSQTKVSPYVKADLRYTYAIESYAEVGVNYDRSPTDALSASGTSYTQDAQDLVVFGSIYQKLAPKFYGKLIGQMQNSTFNGGANDGQNELYYSLGLDLQYHFNSHFSGNVGYNYDKLHSKDSTARNYDRNRVYLGVIATY